MACHLKRKLFLCIGDAPNVGSVRGQSQLSYFLQRSCGPQIALIPLGHTAVALCPRGIKAIRAAKRICKIGAQRSLAPYNFLPELTHYQIGIQLWIAPLENLLPDVIFCAFRDTLNRVQLWRWPLTATARRRCDHERRRAIRFSSKGIRKWTHRTAKN